MYSGFLGTFAKLQKATLSILVLVCPHGTTLLPLDRFFMICDKSVFQKYVKKIKVSLKSDTNNRYFT